MTRIEVKILTPWKRPNTGQLVFGYDAGCNVGKYDWLVVLGVITRQKRPGESSLKEYVKSPLIHSKLRVPQDASFESNWKEAPDALYPLVQRRIVLYVKHNSEGCERALSVFAPDG